MIANKFIDGSTFIFRLDPRLKIIVAVLWSFLVASLHQPKAAVLALAVAVSVIMLNRLSWRLVLRRLLVINVFVAFLWLFLPFSFSVPGEVLAGWSFFKVTREGLALAFLLTVKANAVAMGALALLATSTLVDLAAAARSLGISEKLTAMFFLMIRYFTVIYQELNRLRTAMAARGFRPGLDIHSLRTCANLVGQLLIRSFDRAERVYAAMLCRGYQGKFWVEQDFEFKKTDMVAGFLSFILLMGVAGLEWNQKLSLI